MSGDTSNADGIVRAAIHPAIGIARVGDSESEYYIGPQVTDPPAKPWGFYRDATGALKREAAEFRIYGYDATGAVVQELTLADADITWTVEVANHKAAWYEFQLALDVPEAAMAPPSLRRNADTPDRSDLSIEPGPRSISGAGQGGGAAHTFDTGQFFGTPVYLGELRTDGDGRLLFLGGHGKSASKDGKPATTFANNEGWHDDSSDGPVTATVTIGGRAIPVEPAWVVTAPPNYGPQVKSVRTMFDLTTDVAIQAGMLPTPASVSFYDDILPILTRLSGLEWVNYGFAVQFGWKGPNDFRDPGWIERLSALPVPYDAKADIHRELRQQVANSFREFDRDGRAPMPWPWLYGDAMNVPPADTPRQHAVLTDTQLLMLQRWAAGEFDPTPPAGASPASIDEVPIAGQPAMLDRAALDFCLADAFHPGCEMTWPMRHATMFMAPHRIRHRPAGQQEPDYGSQLSPSVCLSPVGPLHAQGPGDITRWMAVPWQTDTASCRAGYYAGYGPVYDLYVPTFWPARVPNHVVTEEDYAIVMDTSLPLAEREAAFADRASWFRTLGPGPYTKQINFMIDHFQEMGVVEAREGPGDSCFPATIEVEHRGETAKPAPKHANLVALDVAGEALAAGAAETVANRVRIGREAVAAGTIEKVRRFPGVR